MLSFVSTFLCLLRALLSAWEVSPYLRYGSVCSDASTGHTESSTELRGGSCPRAATGGWVAKGSESVCESLGASRVSLPTREGGERARGHLRAASGRIGRSEPTRLGHIADGPYGCQDMTRERDGSHNTLDRRASSWYAGEDHFFRFAQNGHVRLFRNITI